MPLPHKSLPDQEVRRNFEALENRVVQPHQMHFPLSTSLPTSPSNGMLTAYDTGTEGIVWMFRYNADSASSYKWEFVGGSPLSANENGSFTESSTGYSAPDDSLGPDLTLPLAGDYYVEVAALMNTNTSLDEGFMSFNVGGSGASDNTAARSRASQGSQEEIFHPRRRVLITGAAASATVATRYKQSGGTVDISLRELWILPKRVS